MEVYRRHMRQLNRRLLLITALLLVVWFEFSVFQLRPEFTGMLAFTLERVIKTLAFWAWPMLFFMFFQPIVNKFFFLNYDGEVTPTTFKFETRFFFAVFFLYASIGLFTVAAATSVLGIVNMGWAAYTESLQFSFHNHILIQLVRSFTLPAGVIASENIQSPLFMIIGTLILLLGYALYSFVLITSKGRPDKFIKYNKSHQQFEAHNAYFMSVIAYLNRTFNIQFAATLFVVIFFALLIITIFVPAINTAQIVRLFWALVIHSALFLVLRACYRFLKFWWDKIFAVQDHEYTKPMFYESRDLWLNNTAARDIWVPHYVPPTADSSLTSTSRVSKSSSWKMPKLITIPWIVIIEVILFFIVLAIVGGFAFGYHPAYIEMIKSLNAVAMVKAIYQNTGFFWHAIFALYVAWRLFHRFGRFNLGFFETLGRLVTRWSD
ncbi:hypothetical protein CWE13_10600 [Aliidiomarina shirensis]|uniref:Uncharacterized protein n=1 Tax=Aliidiomarina shirensis TaxID=1048642 RepID=A0A432WQB7_9GAMM|nr:hypothetical protein [Aliidiomarina shirensis]RUO35983.1 hypothetical protein CWE13_10600 [Aliidiomarina shirensis]